MWPTVTTIDTDTESIDSGDEEEYLVDRFDEIVSKEMNEPNSMDPVFQEGAYSLGMYWPSQYKKEPVQLLVASMISTKQWFNYSHQDVTNYLRDYSIAQLEPMSKIEIMEVHEQPDLCLTVILKTHWLRLVQRAWRNVIGRRDELKSSFYSKSDPRSCYQLKGMLYALSKQNR